MRPYCALKFPKWLRGLDLNQRPLGYEPNELPGCSTPHLDSNNRGKQGQTMQTQASQWFFACLQRLKGVNGLGGRFTVPMASQHCFLTTPTLKIGLCQPGSIEWRSMQSA